MTSNPVIPKIKSFYFISIAFKNINTNVSRNAQYVRKKKKNDFKRLD